MTLNRIADEVIDERLREHREALATWLAAPPADPSVRARQNYHAAVGRRARDAGLLLSQRKGTPQEVRALLQAGAASALEALTLRLRPEPAVGDFRRLGEFREIVNLVGAFGDVTLRGQAASVPEWQYRFPVSAEDDARALYLDVLKRYLNGEPLDQSACARVEAHAAAAVASKEDCLFLLPDVRALWALASGNTAQFQEALAQLVAAHEREAMRGENRFKTTGLMCLPGLRLARFALDQGLRCTVQSPYLPLDLLEKR